MAWGLVEPSNFGDFFQGGEYNGWEDRLYKYFEEKMPFEEKLIFSNSSLRYISEVARKFRDNVGIINEHEFPVEYKFSDRCKAPGSLMLLADGLIVVEDALRRVIESLDQDIHQFRQINIIDRNGRKIENQYYIIVINIHADYFDPNNSSCFRKDAGFNFYYAEENTKTCYSQIAITRPQKNRPHLWRELKLRSPEIIISDALKAEIGKKNLRIFRHHKIKEI